MQIEFELPILANYIRIKDATKATGSPASIHIKNIPDEDLLDIGKRYGEELVKRKAKMLKDDSQKHL